MFEISGNNFNDWFCQLKMVLRVERKLFVIEQPISLASPTDSEYLRSGMRMRENQLAHMSLDEELCGTGIEIPMEVEGFEPPQEEEIPIRRSERTRRVPNCLCLNVEAEEHSLGDLNEPTSYKAAMLDSESNKWIDVMNAKIQSMMDNMVWVLVDLPPSCKIVGSK
ncbi:hypothetical protein Tco_0775008 [Tanacetum coccineum]